MDKQRILREAQKIAAKFSFWMVSGDISHLYGHVYETPENKYDLEIKFDENFPNSPPNFIYHNTIKELLGEVQLSGLKNWTSESSVVESVKELELKIQEILKKTPSIPEDQELEPIVPPSESGSDKYITPDLNAYPPDFEVENTQSQIDSNIDLFVTNQPSTTEFHDQELQQEKTFEEPEQLSIDVNTELSLIQQYYTYDQKGSNQADINVYLTITISKTYIIGINFTDYPKRPIFSFPEEIISILDDPYKSLGIIKKWNEKKPAHIVDILQELENMLFFIKDIELELKKIFGEYKCEMIGTSATKLKIHLLTYGFKEYILELNLAPFPKPPEINLGTELQQIIKEPEKSLTSYIKWKDKESEPVEIVREIAWLVDKDSRINFEMDLLKKDYENLKYDRLTDTINVDMKGKMKTQDLIFKFQINLPRDYPMKMPEIKLLNEFELKSQEKIKDDLRASLKDFFNEWTPFSYLIDLFSLISKKIFEISAVSCVICHNIECPTCSIKIAGPDSCNISCPHCDRVYHKHCWEQTLNQFGKCGFCLRVP
ncbi:MAG: hypothetical protein ACFFBP_23290 [Promethearchaeota archaeon]